jgi:hypothetical protein
MMSECATITNMEDVERMMSCAMSQLQKGKSLVARKILVDCLTYVKTIDQQQHIVNAGTHYTAQIEDEEGLMIAVPLGKRLYGEVPMNRLSPEAAFLPLQHSDILSSQDGFYFAAFYMSNGPGWYSSNLELLNVVLLYNIAITYHKEGALDGRSTSYVRALHTYKSILRVTKQVSDNHDTAAVDEISHAVLRVIVAVCHNMGHIYKECGEIVLYQRLVGIGSRVVHTIRDRAMPRCDREFFALNHFFATLSDRCCAQAA